MNKPLFFVILDMPPIVYSGFKWTEEQAIREVLLLRPKWNQNVGSDQRGNNLADSYFLVSFIVEFLQFRLVVLWSIVFF